MHLLFFSFRFTKEDGETKLRAKFLPQDSKYVPQNGIQLLKDGVEFEDVKSAGFRIERYNSKSQF